jgi:methylglyoxal synthase
MQQHMRRFEKEKKIALIAHDNKKKDLIEWATYNKKALAKHKLVATGTTGKLIEDALDRKITKVFLCKKK